MMTSPILIKKVALNRKGMVTIPIKLREKYDLHEGTEVGIMELDGVISIIPIIDPELLRQTKYEDFEDLYEKIHQEELELEK